MRRPPIEDYRTEEYRVSPPSASDWDLSAPPAPSAPGRRRSRIRVFLGHLLHWPVVLLLTVVFVASALIFGRQWMESLAVRDYQARAAHLDQSVATTEVRPEVPPQLEFVYRERDGRRVRVLAHPEAYSAFVRRSVARLESARETLHARLDRELTKRLNSIFFDLHGRVGLFADWYFGYFTSYQMLAKALSSTARHAISVEAASLEQMVSQDMGTYIYQHYRDIVLRPEIQDSKLKLAYRESFEALQTVYLEELVALHQEFQLFVAGQTSHTVTTSAGSLELDWQHAFARMHLSQKKDSSAALSALFLGGGGAITGGKVAAGIAGKAVAGKVAGSAATKTLTTKLAAPFVAKAVGMGAMAGGGAATGALAGPLGIAAGAGIGLGVDVLWNEGVELAYRDQFLADVHDGLTATKAEWRATMRQPLAQAVDAWITDAQNLLPRYEDS